MPPSHPQTPAEAGNDETPDDIYVERCQKGDLHAFDALVTRYRGRIYGLLYNLVRNESDAWDLAQDTFLKAWKALPKFEARSSFFTWIYRIAHNVAYDWLRARKIQSGTEFDDAIGLDDIAAGATTAPREIQSPDEKMAAGELGARINDALAQLSPEHRMVILLKEIDGFSYQEIADKVGCTIGTVMSRLFYARKKLQTLLQDVHDDRDA